LCVPFCISLFIFISLPFTLVLFCLFVSLITFVSCYLSFFLFLLLSFSFFYIKIDESWRLHDTFFILRFCNLMEKN
jgi:hypothetical protein